MSKLADLELKQYKETKWYDNMVEYPDRVKLKPINEDEKLYDLIKAEGEVYEEGTPLTARIMNNIEEGIKNNNTYILATIQDVRTLQLQTLILQATILGDVTGEIYMENFETIDNINLTRGIYDENKQSIYCVGSDGQRIELTGFGIAIG